MRGNILDQITDKTKQFEKRYSFEPKKQPVKEMSMREMLGKMRVLNEDQRRTISQAEIDREHEKMQNYFADDGVDIQFQDFDIEPNGVFMSGTIDGQLQFAYKVTPQERDSKAEVNYLDGFDSTDPDNDNLIKKVQNYYNDFKKYWIENELQLKGI